MKTLEILIIVMLLPLPGIVAQNIYKTSKGHASFYSKAPVADVNAHNEKVKAELNTSTHELTVTLAMGDFQFKNNKMGRDARKKYIEIDQYPDASFKGKLTGNIDYNKPGSYPVAASGKLKIHGTEKEVTEKGTVTIRNGQIRLESQFNVALEDYKIETPKILNQEMTEDNVLVKIEATLIRQGNKK
jgi:polyisoprenoid-binding protein YceI